MDTSLFQNRVTVTLNLLVEFGRALQKWQYKTPSDEEIMEWVSKLSELGLMEWLDIGGIDEFREQCSSHREQLQKAV
jgi:hypothetical protein